MTLRLPEGKKHFKQFYLNNTAITEIEENTFYDLTFDEIKIMSASKLTLINTNAFTETNFFTKSFNLLDTPIVSNPPKYDIFYIISQMKNLEQLSIEYTNI
jgi:hypothetical protein